jgi:hypothetical protein
MSQYDSDRESASATSTLAASVAAEIARSWLAERHPPSPGYGEDQIRWVLLDLAGQAFKETARRGDGVKAYRDRLDAAGDVVEALWGILTPNRLKGWHRTGEPTAEEAKAEAAARRYLWKRRDPLVAFREGYESESAVEHSNEEVISVAADYVSSGWMRHPFVDWVLVDALITRELQAFGEEVKQKHLPGRRDLLGVHHRYFATKGNLDAMKRPDFLGAARRAFLYLLINWAIPIGVISLLYVQGWSTTATWFLGIYGALMALHLTFVAVRVVRWMWRTSRGDGAKQPPAFELWTDMHQVWRVLTGPVLNPTLVREHMARTAGKGAVWDNIVWSIVDSRIASDPAVWMVMKTKDAGRT